ncbi:hypothetical protein CCHR01_19162 [Colletotrichum chrysophilum]|uniref:Uncharacterized protein n=1 Tax=Colletotrichum chrysophilum TaxID=1836956 RepID=A0AAD9E5D6_9PEZI|nr:hypothetical protein CCHR01_19162 [Colletotrichum chrysophilum]
MEATAFYVFLSVAHRPLTAQASEQPLRNTQPPPGDATFEAFRSANRAAWTLGLLLTASNSLQREASCLSIIDAQTAGRKASPQLASNHLSAWHRLICIAASEYQPAWSS